MTLKKIKEIEKLTIEASLARTDFNKTRAAKELGISRKKLTYKIKDYQIPDFSTNYRRLRHEVIQLQAAVILLHKKLARIERGLIGKKEATDNKVRK